MYNSITESSAWRSTSEQKKPVDESKHSSADEKQAQQDPSEKEKEQDSKAAAAVNQSQETGPLGQIKKDLRILNQIASRLVINCNEQPVLRVNKPQDIEVVPNIPMVFTSKVNHLPTPVKFVIKYANRQAKDLSVYVSFEPFKQKE